MSYPPMFESVPFAAGFRQGEKGRYFIMERMTSAGQGTIGWALNEGLRLSRQCETHRRNQEKAVKVVYEWFTAAQVVNWNDVTVDHIRAFVAGLEARELSPATIRAYTNPLRLAHRATRTSINAEYLKLKDIIPPRKIRPKRFLTPDQVKLALNLADKGREHAGYLGLALGAMAGLRITEAMQITPADYNPAEQTLIVGQKNDASERIIPLCDAAANVVEWHLDAPSTPRRRKGDGYKCATSISHSARRILTAAYEATGDESFNMVRPAEAGRKSFMNALEELEVEHCYIRAYCGHAPERWDTLGRHYLELTPKPEAMQHVRDKALSRLAMRVVEPMQKLF